jgi:hypothetical protein
MTAQTRRAALTALASVPALALPAVAAATPNDADDAELITLAAEIDRLLALGEDIYAKGVDPSEETSQSLMKEALDARRRNQTDFDERWEKAWAYSRESGREAAIKEQAQLASQADRLWARMMAIPASTQAGRAAKVRALLTHVCPSEWRGPTGPLDWEIQETRALLGQFAGMTEEELAAI